MKMTKKIVSIILALTMLVATVAITASVSASAEDTAKVEPVYMQRFTKDAFTGFGTYKAGELDTIKKDTTVTGDMTYNDDFSFGVETKEYIYGIKTLWKLDDNFKAAFEIAKKQAAEKYAADVEAAKAEAEKKGVAFDQSKVEQVAPSAQAILRVTNSVTKKDVQIDSQIIVKLIMNDDTVRTIHTSYLDMTCTKQVTVPFKYSYKNENDEDVSVIMDSVDDVKSMEIDVYHWNQSRKGAVVSAFVVEGDPSVPEVPDVQVKDSDGDGKLDTTATLVNWDSNYRQDYGGAPDNILYSTDGGATFGGTEKFKKNGGPGWVKYENRAGNYGQQIQTFHKFNHDTSNYALAVANQEGGSHKAQMTVYIESCVDKDNKPVAAQLEILLVTFSKGYEKIIDAWQQPGTTVTYTFDLSNYKQNDLQAVRLTMQNYWYYDENGNMVQYKKQGENDPLTDANGTTIQYGTGVKAISLCPVAYFSPITVVDESAPTTSMTIKTQAPTKATTTAENNPGAGYHAYDFTEEAMDKYWGAETWCTAEQKVFGNDGDVTMISKTRKNKQYQAAWLLKSRKDDTSGKSTVVSEALSKKLTNSIKQGYAYANDPRGLGFLAIDVKVNSAKHPETKKNCSSIVDLMILMKDEMQNEQAQKWCNVGQTVTLYLPTKDTDGVAYNPDNITLVRLSPMNYANVDSKGNSCGMTDINIWHSAVYVPGKDAKGAPTTTKAAGNQSEFDAIYELYKKLPGTDPSLYENAANFALLQRFVEAYTNAPAQIGDYFEKLGIFDKVGELITIYYDLGGDSMPPTGATAAPIAAMFVAAAAGFVIIKSRKK